VHYQNIAHRDLKPDNILVGANGEVKIVDFGVSEMFQGGKDSVRKSAGSPAFMSPEMVSVKGVILGRSLSLSLMILKICFAFFFFFF